MTAASTRSVLSVLPALKAADLPADAVEIGRMADAWGVKGWFKVLPYSAEPSVLLTTRRWYLQPSERAARVFEGTVTLEVRQAREHSGGVVAWAQGVDDRTAAEVLKGCRIFVSRSVFPKAAEDEYYWVDLIGLAVINREQIALGTVRDLLTTGPQTVLVLESAPTNHAADADTDTNTDTDSGSGTVKSGNKGGDVAKPVERMIPFVAAFIDQVDLAGGRILVDWQPDF